VVKKVDYDPKITHTVDEIRSKVNGDVNEVTKDFKKDTKIIIQPENKAENTNINSHPGATPEFAKKESTVNVPKKIIDRNAKETAQPAEKDLTKKVVQPAVIVNAKAEPVASKIAKPATAAPAAPAAPVATPAKVAAPAPTPEETGAQKQEEVMKK
jgi:hypothetical protein